MEITKEVLEAILDAYVYEIVFVDRHHIIRYLNKAARKKYEGRISIGDSLFNCHNEAAKAKIEAFLKKADEGEAEMYQNYNQKTGEREFFVPVRDKDNKVIGYFERHEVPWDDDHPEVPIGDYWNRRK